MGVVEGVGEVGGVGRGASLAADRPIHIQHDDRSVVDVLENALGVAVVELGRGCLVCVACTVIRLG